MGKQICEVCEYIYDEKKSGTAWENLPDNWICPVCASSKKLFKKIEEDSIVPEPELQKEMEEDESVMDLNRTMSDTESYLSDIHEIARTGKSINEPMRTKHKTISWDDILIKGAQLSKIPLNRNDPVDTRTIIGPNAKYPLVTESPILISHMSFGALSREAKIALARGSAAVKTVICSGEGGILPDEFENAYKYILEYVPNKYSITKENLQKVDAVEIKFGQSSKPGMGGHLPAEKVTREISEIRGFKQGEDIISPSHFPDIKTREDLKQKVDWLREQSLGKPVGIKLAAGNIEDDLKVALFAGPDFITFDGRTGSTGSSPKFIKSSTSIPTVFALYRARKFLDENGGAHVSLIITGGLRVSSDFAKALAMGADAVAIGTAALIAIGCQQYRVCNTGKCPVGIATQDPDLRRRFNVDQASKQLENYLSVSTEELKIFARLTGNNKLNGLGIDDLCTTNSEISGHTTIPHV